MNLIEATEAAQRAKEALEEAKAEVLANPTPGDIEMAEVLHSRECKLSHEDQCGWEWDKYHNRVDWTKGSRRNWLLRARLLRESGITIEQLVKPDEIARLLRAI